LYAVQVTLNNDLLARKHPKIYDKIDCDCFSYFSKSKWLLNQKIKTS
jgi:hypothetical protein